ncbi:hypothetical protein Asppvi_004836 [Aspergillus pseudoviridinutans]|uniref:Aflatoxin regulatory protein domain-containing protein n=1 Tax=Aspergillus pseudoviridinutans TaxID=1517512 RepID=A0A9P3BAY7_9EURO|nr:uncharacterized protein Asppvi_004836 [Aspergillus pseudoviridinutans]GIJ85965.1 hypothetical protein Asppvi_004836 [Aspergillus pseudoviridinutans]
MTTTCPCPPQIKHLSSTIPTEGSFDFGFIPTITQPLTDLSKSIETCKHPCHNYSQDLNTPLVDLSDAVLSLCHAACTTYDLLGDELSTTATAAATGNGTATPAPTVDVRSQLRCTKSPMVLGRLTLQAEEEAILARQVVYAVLTRLSTLLRDVYIRSKEAAGASPVNGATATATATVGVDFDLGRVLGTRSGLYGREGDGPVSQCLSRVLALLGRLFIE